MYTIFRPDTPPPGVSRLNKIIRTICIFPGKFRLFLLVLCLSKKTNTAVRGSTLYPIFVQFSNFFMCSRPKKETMFKLFLRNVQFIQIWIHNQIFFNSNKLMKWTFTMGYLLFFFSRKHTFGNNVLFIVDFMFRGLAFFIMHKFIKLCL